MSQLTADELAELLCAEDPDKPVIANGWPVVGVRDAGTKVEVQVFVNDRPEDVVQ